MRKIRITMPNGDEFDLDADFINGIRAKYFADKDAGDLKDNPAGWWKSYHEEKTVGVKDPVELIDYLANQMDWSEISSKAVPVPKKIEEPNYVRLFRDAKFKMVGTGSI